MLAVRGAVAAVVLVVGAAALVAYGGDAFDDNPEVSAEMPAAAGLVNGSAAVRYQGVSVGKLAEIDSDTASSKMVLRMDRNQIGRIPASVLVRVVPRTLFGGVYLDLAVPANAPISTARLRGGDQLTVDTSPQAVQLYQLYSQVSVLLNRLQPDKMQIALTAMSTALRGRGAALGQTIDRLAAVSGALLPLFDASLASAPEVTKIASALSAAAPDLLASMSAATELSQTLLDNKSGVEGLLSAGVGLAALGGAVVQENSQRAITVVHNGARVLSTVAANTAGLSSTLDQLDTFGAAGAKIFATGKFNITAVPSFADPLPYTAADCPRYPGIVGANCAAVGTKTAAKTAAFVPGVSDVVSGTQEQASLSYLQQTATNKGPDAGRANVAAFMMLAPLVRGMEVHIP